MFYYDPIYSFLFCSLSFLFARHDILSSLMNVQSSLRPMNDLSTLWPSFSHINGDVFFTWYIQQGYFIVAARPVIHWHGVFSASLPNWAANVVPRYFIVNYLA